MKKKILVVLILIVAFLYIFISINGIKNSTNETLRVYAINDYESTNNVSLENKTLLFTDNDIKEYNWESHRITFTDEFLNDSDTKQNIGNTKKFLTNGGSTLLGTSGREKFIVMIDEEVIYDGYFKQSMVSSFYPIGAVISDINGGIRIDFNGIEGLEKDIRNDKRIRKILEDKDIFSN